MLKRLIRSVLVILGVCLVVFLAIRSAPGDPTVFLLGASATPEAIAEMRTHLGLDQPTIVQVGKYTWSLLQGDFGVSIVYQEPALSLIGQALPNTLYLSGAAFAIASLLALPLGVLGAMRRGGMSDRGVTSLVVVAQSMPTFWIGILLIELFAVKLHWLPTSGSGNWRHLVLPAVTLSTVQLAVLTRSVRSGMLEVLGEDFIRAARAKGAGPTRVAVVHALRNALIPVVTLMALQFGTLLAGAVITEAVFAWPGIGSLALNSIIQRDYPVVQAIVVLGSVAIVVANLVADMLYVVLDPRLRTQAA